MCHHRCHASHESELNTHGHSLNDQQSETWKVIVMQNDFICGELRLLYFITFSKNNTTIDSDGLQGTYSIVFVNDKYQLNVIAKTINGNSINYTNTLVLVNPTTMIQSYTTTGQAESTLLYFSAK
jgi:hypothetical protein